ncbi:hypothetical protein BB8028_0004g10720 [Beauveria bassiana]|uniref:DUF1763-domain-containing protein n=1 Tax=Beauveria bassiana TaxID=176275 RepID=A0A2S7YE45_BEABA|nr:hypothetical protein BB8028_0004g10720 [Beauveria bassiana]
MASRQEVLHAYRHLYKGLLRGVHYSIPARYIVRDQIRLAFRERPAATAPAPAPAPATATATVPTTTTTTTTAAAAGWDAEAIRRTLWFLSAAGRQSGLEHRILRNLVRMHSERAAPTRRWRRAVIWNKKPANERERHEHAFEHYDATVAMLNKSMGLCLR